MRLRYTGPVPITFPAVGVETEPGDEFDVPDEDAAGFLSRADVESVPDPEPEAEAPKAKTRAKDAPTAEPAATPDKE